VHDFPLIADLLILLAVSLPVVFLTRRLGLPALVGFLLTGVALGPGALGAVESADRVTRLAEIGVMLLLFTIGLEFSLARLGRMARLLIGAGSIQVGVTVAVVGFGAWMFDYTGAQAAVLGFIVALSSTALCLAMLESRGELESAYAGPTLAILLFQDLCVVPILMVLPVLAGAGKVSVGAIVLRSALGLAAVGVVAIAARRLMPFVLRQVLRLRSHELFIGVIVLTCFGTAWLTATLGLSLAIGAFLAGLIVSESEYSHQVVADVLPLRDLFSSVFFVSVGMLLDPAIVLEEPVVICALTAGVLAVKTIVAGNAVLPFRASPQVALLSGVALSQVGEFSFVITSEAARLDLLTGDTVQRVVAVSVFTMLMTPFLSHVAARIAESRELPGLIPDADLHGSKSLRGHVVVVGYGHNGRNLSRVLREAGVPYRAVDVDLEAVGKGKDEGDPVIFGDATRPIVLRRIRADEAAAIAVTFTNPDQVRRMVSVARQVNPHASIVVRTRYVDEMDELYDLGASDVIPEEFEATVDMFARILQSLSVPKNVIAAQVDVIRSRHYALLRGKGESRSYLESLYELFTAATVVTYLVRPDSPAIGRSIGEIALERHAGTKLTAVVRRGESIVQPGPDFVVDKGDILVLTGAHAQIAAARDIMEPPSTAEQGA
jgi:CPA2 family monovalent cation:H+ antiporter-2